jgi:N-methylhydantoinase B
MGRERIALDKDQAIYFVPLFGLVPRPEELGLGDDASIYVAMKHIFPDVPINAGCFAPIHIAPPDGTFHYARYPRPVADCAAEVAQRIMEAVFGAMGQALPERLFAAAPAGTSGNFGLGGYDPEENRHYLINLFSGGGCGGWWQTDGLTNGCSSVADLEDPARRDSGTALPDRFDRFALREGSGAPGGTAAVLGSTTRSGFCAARRKPRS